MRVGHHFCQLYNAKPRFPCLPGIPQTRQDPVEQDTVWWWLQVCFWKDPQLLFVCDMPVESLNMPKTDQNFSSFESGVRLFSLVCNLSVALFFSSQIC